MHEAISLHGPPPIVSVLPKYCLPCVPAGFRSGRYSEFE